MKKSQVFSGLGSELIDHQHSYPEGGIGGPKGSSFPLGKFLDPKVPEGRKSLKAAITSVIRMWKGGPLRNWSRVKTSKTPFSYAQDCFAGAYVCDGCLESCDGLYRLREEQSWLCGRCKQMLTRGKRVSRRRPELSRG